MRAVCMTFIFFYLSVSLAGGRYVWINPDEIQFGYEATFQTQQMADEDGPRETETAPKRKKFELFKRYIVEELKSFIVSDEPITNGKPGSRLTLASGEVLVMTMEPTCIEVNITPKKSSTLKKSWAPIYAAADRARLVSSIYTTGSRSGGGQFHIGGTQIETNPFLKHPLLLRNLVLYYNQHPSLLYSFFEASDLGENSSAMDFHTVSENQDKLRQAIDEFDAWFNSASEHERKNSFKKLIHAFINHGLHFNHNYFLNLSNMNKIFDDERRTNEKLTVEIRPVRPMPSERHAQSFSELLLSVMDYLAKPGFKVANKTYSTQQSRNQLNRLLIENDWDRVKKDLDFKDPLMDQMVYEYTRNPFMKQKKRGEMILRESYAEFERDQQNLELIVEVKDPSQAPQYLLYEGLAVEASLVAAKGRLWAVAVVHLDKLSTYPLFSAQHAGSCRALFP